MATAPKAQAKTETSILEQLRKLNEEQAKLTEARLKIVDAAKAELLNEGQRILGELKSLGYEYTLAPFVPGPSRVFAKKAIQTGEGQGRSAPRAKAPEGTICPICNFATSPVHDRRAHRFQEEKKPFDANELMAKKFQRVG